MSTIHKQVIIYYSGFLLKAGGAFNHARTLQIEFQKIGWDVKLITLDSLPVWCRYFPHIAQIIGNFVRFPYGFLYKGKVIRILYKIFFNKKTDLRIFEDIYIAWDSLIPSVCWLHAVWSDNLQAYSVTNKQIINLKKQEIGLLTQLYQPIVTVSYPYREYLINEHFVGFTIKEIIVIENGINQSVFIKNKKQNIHNKSIIYTGTLEKRKNIIFLLEVFKKLFELDNSYCLTVVGDGPERSVLDDFVRRNNLSVKFLGKLRYEEVIQELYNHLIYVHTSKQETFSFSLLEAKLAGLKTVAYKGLEVPEEFIDIAISDFSIDSWVESITSIKFIKDNFDGSKYTSGKMLQATLEVVNKYQNFL
jgi:glycosyltransferase involved in cell wall biosynthesis